MILTICFGLIFTVIGWTFLKKGVTMIISGLVELIKTYI